MAHSKPVTGEILKMPIAEQQVTDFLNAPNRDEFPGSSGGQTVIVNYNMTDKTTLSGSLDSILAEKLQGMSNVQLDDITVIYKPSAVGHKIAFGTTQLSDNIPASLAGMLKNGHSYEANQYNMARMIVNLVPNDSVSKQIKPCSSVYPMMKFVMSKSAEMDCLIQFTFHVHGTIYYYMGF